MTIDKKEMARQLKQASRLLEVLGEDPFRVRAYENAARNIEAFEGDVTRLLEQDRLSEIRGVGKGLAAELSALKHGSRLALLEELELEVPQGIQDLFGVAGLGGKRIRALWNSGISDVQTLVEAARDGRLEKVAGFGKKSAQGVGTAAEFALESARRMRLDSALSAASLLCERLSTVLPQARMSSSGSLRRGLETIGDFDLVIGGVAFDQAVQAVTPHVEEMVAVKPPRITARYQDRSLDVGVAEVDAFGAVLAMWTGNADFRGELKRRADDLGLRLCWQGLFHADRRRIATPEESDLFEALQLPYVAPELRESPRIEAVPDLVAPEQVKGSIHNHTVWSDGVPTIHQLSEACIERGYRYLGLADHSKSSQVANGLSVDRLYRQAREVDEVRAELRARNCDFQLLHGVEVDILRDGRLDFEDEVLAELDYVVVSVHQNFGLSPQQQTERIVKAVSHPLADILAHPSGRLLLQRPPYEFDLAAVIEACADTGTVIEINANPRRLDLDWRWVIRAKELGCRFAVNPDAHTVAGLDDLRYGVMMARKAGLEPKDVVNTAASSARFLALLKRGSS